VSELIEIEESFIRYLDKLEAESPGQFYPVATLVGAIATENIRLPDDLSYIQFLEKLQQWDWIESNGDGFETENQSFRVTAKGQYRAVGSVDFAEQYTEFMRDLPMVPDAPVEYKSKFALNSIDSTLSHVDMQPVFPVNSQSWTGLQRDGVLGEEAVISLKAALSTIDDAVLKSSASNQEIAQARAYVLAIHALADAPEPPADLIWELVSRANQLAGIASFFISIIALYSSVSA
jgi:hypothetical protein